MNPGEPPPSLSSRAISSFDQENLQLVDPMGIYNPPAISFSGHFPAGPGNSLVLGEGFNRGLNEQPPSRGAVRPFVGSQTSGGVNSYPSAQAAPSFNDVRGQQASQTGPLFNGITEKEALDGVSLTADDFKRIDPNAFQKDK